MSFSWMSPLCLSIVLLSGCAPGSPPARVEDLRGPRLTRPLPKPDLQLTGEDGQPYDFRAETRGHLTFLFFGYTHCPDVCPLHMANLAAALHALPPKTAAQVRVVFVTTDPERDTPERLREWLGNFDSTFVGARGEADALAQAQRGLGMPTATRDPEVPDSGGYTISHGAHLWAFTPDDSAHVVYPLGITREDLTADIGTLLKLWPSR